MKSFEELNVSLEIRKAIEEMGFENPMPVQEEVIPLMLGKKNDIVALAQTGTGKTAAYGVPLIQEADFDNPLPAALVLCPTRELCIQITGDLNDYAKYCKGIKAVPVYGGSSIETQIRTIKNGVQIIVATPGRMLDLMRRKAVKLKNVSRVILDEADEMLNMGFLEDINEILSGVQEGRNTLLFSATMPNEIVGISKKYMNNPTEITIGKRNAGAANIKHICYTVHSRDKYLALKRIADFNPEVYCIVFCRTRRETQEIADKLIADGYNADSLHGDLSQLQRDSVMQKFRNRNLRILVATDVAARGLDVDDITHIINYALPDSPDIYTHRSGRTGRTGKAGISIAIVNMREKFQLKIIERKLGKTFEHCTLPTGKEICEKQLFYFIGKMENVEIDHSQINSYLPSIFKKLEGLDKEEIITRFVSLEFNRFLEYYKNSKDINATEERGGEGSSKNKRRDFESMGGEGYARLFINLGKKDGVYPAELINLINANTSGLQVPIGRIDLNKIFSFFEVKKEFADDVIKAMCKARFKDRNVFVERASERKEKSENDSSDDRKYVDKKRYGKERSYGREKEFSRDEKPNYKKKFHNERNSSQKNNFRKSGKDGNDRGFFKKKVKAFRKRQDS
ncbi:MAG: DEAD/DEAH box helicase [Bacteroidales bacterium]|jgi:ATP-dependent RNA helicase DeaD